MDRKLKKWKCVLIISLLPFIGVLLCASYFSVVGLGMFLSNSFGIEAFLGTILIISMFAWPLYIVSIIFIVISIKKIKEIKKK